MYERLIESSELAPGAVVPQCLDVHYNSDQTFREIVRENRSYDDPIVAARRARDARLEYRRALVYAPQVVVNRAYLYNPIVSADFDPATAGETSRRAFGDLLRQRAIVPFLFGERTVRDPGDLRVSPRARDAVDALDDVVDEVACLRLHTNDDENRARMKYLALAFRGFCAGISQLAADEDVLRQMAADVLAESVPTRAQLVDFGRSLVQISRFAIDTPGFNRTDIYERFFVRPGTEHYQGRFLREDEDRFVRARQKLIDLSYNANLAEALGRFVLTPLGLPGHATMRYFRPGSLQGGDLVERFMNGLTRDARITFMSEAHEAMFLPALEDLSIEDVAALRELPEWHRYVALQALIVRDPLAHLDLLEKFYDALAAFQRAFAAWHFRVYGKARRVKAYSCRVRLALRVAGHVFIQQVMPSGVGHGLERLLVNAATGALVRDTVDLIPERAVGYVAQLLVELVDPNGFRDPNLGYALDLVSSKAELTRGAILDLLARFCGDGGLGTDDGQPSGAGGETPGA